MHCALARSDGWRLLMGQASSTIIEECASHQRAVDSTLSSAESYTCIPEGRISKLCECLTSFASRWALLTIVPIPTGLHRPRKERGCYTYCSRLSCVSLFCISMSKFNFCEQAGNRTPHHPGKSIKSGCSFLSVCRACTPGDNSYICRT